MSVGEWLWKIAVKKAVKNGIKTFLAAYGAQLAGFGVTINEAVLVGSLVSGLEFARNWLKVSKNVKWL